LQSVHDADDNAFNWLKTPATTGHTKQNEIGPFPHASLEQIRFWMWATFMPILSFADFTSKLEARERVRQNGRVLS